MAGKTLNDTVKQQVTRDLRAGKHQNLEGQRVSMFDKPKKKKNAHRMRQEEGGCIEHDRGKQWPKGKTITSGSENNEQSRRQAAARRSRQDSLCLQPMVRREIAAGFRVRDVRCTLTCIPPSESKAMICSSDRGLRIALRQEIGYLQNNEARVHRNRVRQVGAQ